MACCTHNKGIYCCWLLFATLTTKESIVAGYCLLHSQQRNLLLLVIVCYTHNKGIYCCWLLFAALTTKESIVAGYCLLHSQQRNLLLLVIVCSHFALGIITISIQYQIPILNGKKVMFCLQPVIHELLYGITIDITTYRTGHLQTNLK